MHTTKSRRIALASIAIALTFAGAAAGFTTGRVFQVQPGDRADIHIHGAIWSCSSTRGQYVTCQGGDAFPYVELGGSTWGPAIA